MNKELLISWYAEHHLEEADAILALKLLDRLEAMTGASAEATSETDLDRFLAHLRVNDETTIPVFRQLMRSMRFLKRGDLFVHLTRYTGGIGVLESIAARLKRIVGNEKAELILNDFQIPTLGTPPAELPKAVELLMKRLRSQLDEKTIHDVLADNHHGIPKEAYFEEKIRYETADSLETYLKEAHDRQVAVLEKHWKTGEVWFEQIITEEVLDFVRSNQEVLSARLEDNRLYMTKIPYDTKAYLAAKDSKTRRYFACHCPFAREAIRMETPVIDPHWCSCSAGFHKHPYEVILGQKLSIRCLKNALEEDALCRFSIDLTDVEYRGKPSRKTISNGS